MAGEARGNKPRGGGAPRRKGGSPLVTGVVIGVLVGLAVALGLALYLSKGPSPFTVRKAPDAAKPAGGESDWSPGKADAPGGTAGAPGGKGDATASSRASPAPGDEKDSLQFHEILRGPKDGRDGGREVKPGPVPAPPVEDVFFLQVASLSSAADADTLKVQLTLSGFEPRIQSVQLDGGKVVHRVRLGPFASVKDAENALVDVKRKNQIEGRIVKEKQPAPRPEGAP
jgi:cell division protein FtsN